MKKKIVAASAVLVATAGAAAAQDAGFAETLSGTVTNTDILAGLTAIGTLALTVTLGIVSFRKIRQMLSGM